MQKKLALVAMVLVCFYYGIALAAEKVNASKPLPTLSEVVVTASRIEQESGRVPANVSVINEEEIRNSNAKSSCYRCYISSFQQCQLRINISQIGWSKIVSTRAKRPRVTYKPDKMKYGSRDLR